MTLTQNLNIDRLDLRSEIAFEFSTDEMIVLTILQRCECVINVVTDCIPVVDCAASKYKPKPKPIKKNQNLADSLWTK